MQSLLHSNATISDGSDVAVISESDVMADAIERAGSTEKDAIIKALGDTTSFTGIAGPVSFTDKNTLARSNFVTLIAKDGKWVLSE